MLATVDHAACTEILRGDDFGVAGGHGELPRPLRRLLAAVYDDGARGPVDPPSMLAVDPPSHTRYRKLVSRAFTARAVRALEERTRETAEELLDQISARGRDRVDIVDTYAAQLPVVVVAEILGVPRSMHQQLLKWGNGAAVTLDPALPGGSTARPSATCAPCMRGSPTTSPSCAGRRATTCSASSPTSRATTG